jgi:tetratricopeptide (TPR) repeat protein
MMKNQYDDAIALFKKVIELDPNNQLAKNNLAWGMDEKNKNSSKK